MCTPTSSIPTSISASRFSVRRGRMRKTDAFLRTRKVFDTADLCGRGAQGARTNRGGRAVPCAHESSVTRRAPRLCGSRGAGAALHHNTVCAGTGGHPSRLFMRRGVTPCWPRFGARHLSPISLPCRNLAHIMLAAIYKHDFKPAVADAIAIGVACTPPPTTLPAPIYRSTFVFMTGSRCFFRGLSDIFVNARVSEVLLVGTLTWPVTNAGTMFVSGFDRRIALPLPFLVLTSTIYICSRYVSRWHVP